MRIAGTTVQGDTNSSGVEVNFGRILKFVISYPTRDSNGDPITETVIYEYNPYAKSTYTPKLEAVINCRPQLAAGMDTRIPGFSAKLTVYNPGEDLYKAVDSNPIFKTTNKEYTSDAFKSNRPYVEVYAGYWDYENKTEGYNKLFSGWLNSSSYYRKGVDVIMELWCHNVKMDINESGTVSVNTDSVQDRIDQIKSFQVAKEKKDTYLAVMKNMIKSLAATRSNAPFTALDAISNVVKKNTKLQSNLFNLEGRNPKNYSLPLSRELTDTEKETDGWIEVNPIVGSFDVNKTGRYIRDSALAEVLSKYKVPKNFYFVEGVKRSDSELKKQLHFLFKNFPGGSVQFEHDPVPHNGNDWWYIWYIDSTIPAKTSSSNTISKPTVVLEDFQNFMEAPVCNGNGQIVLKMLFNPSITPDKNIMLLWDQYETNTILKPKTDKIQGGQVNANLAYYAPLFQVGRYGLAAKATPYNNGKRLVNVATGDIFNRKMGVVTVVHELSSMGNKWSTTVTTSGYTTEG